MTGRKGCWSVVGIFLLLGSGYLIWAYVSYTSGRGVPLVSKKVKGSYYSLGFSLSDHPLKWDVEQIQIYGKHQISTGKPSLLADPFVWIENETTYVFYEHVKDEKSRGADIGLLSSRDRKTWHYEGIVLDESRHISYPLVFKEGGQFYMVPETQRLNEVRLYTTTAFPKQWFFKKTLISKARLADPTIIKHDQHWYIFAGDSEQKICRLYHSKNLEGDWSEHSASPILSHAAFYRPGGRILNVDGQLVRLVQDQRGGYGRRLHAMLIEELSPTTYSEKFYEGNPVLENHGTGWAKHGMHHLDAVQLKDGEWFGVCDGLGFGEARFVLDFEF